MEFEFNPANLEALFYNRFPLSETFCLLQFVPCTKHSVDNPFKDEHDNFFYLDIANNYVNKLMHGTKTDWLLSTINYPIFDRKHLYLYKHNGEFGYYNFSTNIFTRFSEDITQRVYKFYYDKMNLH